MKKTSCSVRRYNIYSCLSVKVGGVELCFDPAKIRKEDIESIYPDYIFISHESMDHMDPTQVYYLQKRKNCKIFCSIASAVDLIQQYPFDSEFIGNIHPLFPGCKVSVENLYIEVEKSLHCDYMYPLVFRISITTVNVAILHCFDSFISEEIKELSKNTSLAIIPIGIAKGISINSGVEFVNNLYSKYYMTNHFKSHSELKDFERVIGNTSNIILLDWDECQTINLDCIDTERSASTYEPLQEIYKKGMIHNTETSKYILSYINQLKITLIDKNNLKSLFLAYVDADEEGKKVLLTIYIILGLWDVNLIDNNIFTELVKDLAVSPDTKNNNLQTLILFFLGVYAQQSNEVLFLENAVKMGDSEHEHNEYWVVEYLGRCLVSQKRYYKKFETELLNIINDPIMYESVVIRRKIFWELYRIMKVMPTLANSFMQVFEDGLTDMNPDVKLLATICLALANRVMPLSKLQLDKIFDLLEDEEDDVRETAVKVARELHQFDYVINNKSKLFRLLNDKNYHVRHQAELTKKLIEEKKYYEKFN